MSLRAHDPQTVKVLVEALERAAESRRRRNAARAYLSATLMDSSPSVRSEAASTLNAIWNATVGVAGEGRGAH